MTELPSMTSTARRAGLVLLPLLVVACGGGEGEVTEVVASGKELDRTSLAALGAAGRAKGHDLLVITLDTVREDHLGCSGYAGAETPFIDGLAETGVRFEHAIAPTPITLPSHASLFTGLDAVTHGVRNNGTFVLGEAHVTLAEQLKEAGYLTAAFVGAYVLDDRFGLAQGFDHYDDSVNPSTGSRRSGHFNERSAYQVTEAALAWMRSELPKAPDRPLFTWLHFYDAHHPYEPPGEYGMRFRSRPYDGEIAFMDAQIARLFEYLESIGRANRTLSVITSDHGEGLGEHSEQTHSRLLYDSTLRVPLILSSPGLFPEAVVVRDRVAGLVDLTPTLLDLLGVESSQEHDGRNLFSAEVDEDRSIYVETLAPLLNHGWAPLQGLHRLGDKFIAAPAPEFYDVAADPGELDNLYPGTPPGAERLEQELAQRLAGEVSPLELRGSEEAMDPELARRLAALGYTRTALPRGPIGVLDPKDMMPAYTQMMEARTLTDSGQHGSAEAKNRAILAQNPNDAFAWETASLIYVRTGRNNEALNALTRMLEIQPTAEGHVRMAQLQLQLRDLPGMQESLSLAAALDPREGGVFMVTGDALAMQGRFAEARSAFQRALELDPIRWGSMAREKLALIDSRTR